MACRQYGVKQLFEPVLPYCQSDTMEYISVKSYLKFKKVFIQGNALENVVCEHSENKVVRWRF